MVFLAMRALNTWIASYLAMTTADGKTVGVKTVVSFFAMTTTLVSQ